MTDLLPSCFKAYDVRGRVPDELNEDLAYNIGRAYVEFTGAKSVAVGQDMRFSSQPLVDALSRGITEQGADVIQLGLCGTEEVYYATFSENLGGGIMVTASHNPPEYNGLKFVREGSRPISADSGLVDIGLAAVAAKFEPATDVGEIRQLNLRERYAKYLLGYVELDQIKPMKVVVNSGNGVAGLVVDALEGLLPIEFIKLQHEPDGNFPNGVPNPLLTQNRAITSAAVREHKANFGIAWDGDFDRCFLFDETGEFIEGYYIVGLLAAAMLQRETGGKIIHDPRMLWNTLDICESNQGQAIQSKSGHAFIKETMRLENAIYGGEMSAHHYFRDFAYCDNGNIPWLLVMQLMCQTGQPLSALVNERIAMYPGSGEINVTLADADAAFLAVEEKHLPASLSVDRQDGISVDMGEWRFSLRKSNTEPLVRLNVESRQDRQLMEEKTTELLSLIKQFEHV
ncbi:MAG: phosphomannomutase [Gammaproteobacteria bacterium]